MSFLILFGILGGGAIGWFAAQQRLIDLSPPPAAAVGAAGGLLGGLALKLILPLALALLFALIGVAIVFALYKTVFASKR